MIPFTPGARPTYFYKKFPPPLAAVAGIRHFVNRNLNIRWHLKSRNYCVTFRPQFGAPKMLRPGADVPPCPHLVTPLPNTVYTSFIFKVWGGVWHSAPLHTLVASTDIVHSTWFHSMKWEVVGWEQFWRLRVAIRAATSWYYHEGGKTIVICCNVFENFWEGAIARS